MSSNLQPDVMEPAVQSPLGFYLTGKASAGQLETLESLALRPAALAPYRDLAALRYDFPVVLLGEGGACAESLSALVERALEKLSQEGKVDERLQKQLWRLEREIRALLAGGARGSLASLWNEAAARVAPHAGESAADGLSRARAAMPGDAQVIDCDRALPAAFVRHAWERAQKARARRLVEDCDRLVLRLTDILDAELVHSDAGLSAQNLKASVGTLHADVFDFQALSRLLGKTAKRPLSAARHERVRSLIGVLRDHRFRTGSATPGAPQPYAFVFRSCAEALGALRERLPAVAAVARALAVAELEVRGEYSEERHDALFENYASDGLGTEQAAMFPDYLVCLEADCMEAAESEALAELLSLKVPVKVLLQTDELLEKPGAGGPPVAVGARARRFAAMALGLDEVFVLQASASQLLQLREALERGLAYAGPALFSIYSGAGSHTALPAYLNAAAALESRAFPAYVYDPAAGPDWASRLRIDANPQLESEWCAESVEYEDADHQRCAEQAAFTLADFIACDRRFARHFARVPRGGGNGSLAPEREWLAGGPGGVPSKVPYLLMVDEQLTLHKIVVDEAMMREAKQCSARWRSLQELGGVNNSHARRLLEREKTAWEEQRRAEQAQAPQPSAVAAAAPAAAAAAAAPTAAAAPAAEAEAPSAQDSGEPYIETPRCTTCEECMKINNRMFVYDANKQAYIKDLAAGTFKQLVEAAEACQVSIIHPGKPRDPNEPGVQELLKRAEAFA